PHPRGLAGPVRRRARRPVLPRLRPPAPEQALPPRLAAHGRRPVLAVLLPLLRTAGQLAHPGPDRAPVRLAVRRGDPAPPPPPRPGPAVRDVALPRSGAGGARHLALRLRQLRSGRDRLLAHLPRGRRRRLFRTLAAD